MTCPICDQKTRNCDCSQAAIWHFERANEAEEKLAELEEDAKRYRFIRDVMAIESSSGSWCLFDSALKGSNLNEAIDKEMEI